MKTRINPSKKGKSLLLTFYEGFSTYTITVPMPYAVQVFAECLHTAFVTLLQSEELQSSLSERDADKAEIQDHLMNSLKLFDEFLKSRGR
ncbi:MAG: hypothetical protein KGD60_11330 [Candidatus Thorarchaeota archaeon]|nr:hypothetical protein [Candidatus Thorarchaeota archaeon]